MNDIIDKINHLHREFNEYIEKIYRQYEILIADYMIISGYKPGEVIQLNIPVVIEDIEAKLDTFTSNPHDLNHRDEIDHDSYLINLNFPNIWSYMDKQYIGWRLNRDKGDVIVEINYILKLTDNINKTVTLTIKKNNNQLPEQKSFLLSEAAEREYGTILKETNFSELHAILTDIYLPVSLPDIFQKFIQQKEGVD